MYCITDITEATYRRYMDDAEGVALNEELMLNAIAEQEPDRRISWELDFQQDDKFVPFLDAKLYIDNQGVLHSRYYRKPQKKAITLNAKSHNLSSTKTEMVRNYYRITETVSSSQELNYSLNIADDLLRKN